jgi:hypothetical protein
LDYVHVGDGSYGSTQITFKEEPSGALIDARVKRIITLDSLLKLAEVDLKKWYVERHVINKWEVGAKDSNGDILVEPLFQVKVWLKPVSPMGDISKIIQDQVEDMKAYSPSARYLVHPVTDSSEQLMYEINVADLHFGMYAWGDEAGTNYDSKVARELFLDCVQTLANRVQGMPVERFVVPLGNDLLHVDGTIEGKGGKTTRGTPQDVDTRYRKMFHDARTMLVDAINELAHTAPVDVVIVPGNHDRERMFCLGDSLESWFWKDTRINVDNTPPSRKYYEYGTNLIGYTHGSDEKPKELPQIMAAEMPLAWARTKLREWHVGHFHRLSEAVNEFSGVRVRVVPSIVPNDEWHTRMGYIHYRAAEAYLYDYDKGFVGLFSVGA